MKIINEANPFLQMIIFSFPICLIGYFLPLTILYELLFNKIKKITLKMLKLEKISFDEIYR
jgi:hypothetical protein